MDGVELRRAGSEDAGAIADVWLASYRATYDFPRAHSDEEVRQHVREVLVPAVSFGSPPPQTWAWSR